MSPEHPCLWKVKLEVNKDKDRRDRCMEALCNQLNSAQTEVVTVDIIKKIQKPADNLSAGK
uniref:MADF domain-containing protein n=1 Tax=Anguilla anguilla TaxID=7936 RepID=A0A0E9XPD6_ANGAN